MARFCICLSCIGFTFGSAGSDHVVIVVFDGMRQDFVRPQFAPNLYALSTNGVFFRHHHPAFISTTIVNGTTIATGAYPGHSGILANIDFHPDLDYLEPVATEALNTTRRGDLLSGGHYIDTDTMAELVQAAGFRTAIAGTKTVALLQDRRLRLTDTAAHSNSITLFRGMTLPRAALEDLKKANDNKDFPAFTAPNTAADQWTTRALTKGLWKNGVPKFSLLWLSDPDATQHPKGVGSPEALAGIESSDKNLGTVIQTLKDKGFYETTDILVASDHGFSTIAHSADIAATLRLRGVNAHGKLDNPEPGDVLVVSLGGSALIYVIDHREDVLRKTVEVLQTSDFTGVIFSRLEIDGTFPLTTIHYPTTTEGPDLVVSMRWWPDLNEHGAPGYLIATGGSRNAATHGSLCRYDMNNTLVASGPSFKHGYLSEVPSGNIDLAPTVLHLLGIQPKEPMDGRVLREALAEDSGPVPEVNQRRLEASRQVEFLHWSQYLQVSSVNGVDYYDEGNGELTFVR